MRILTTESVGRVSVDLGMCARTLPDLAGDITLRELASDRWWDLTGRGDHDPLRHVEERGDDVRPEDVNKAQAKRREPGTDGKSAPDHFRT